MVRLPLIGFIFLLLPYSVVAEPSLAVLDDPVSLLAACSDVSEKGSCLDTLDPDDGLPLVATPPQGLHSGRAIMLIGPLRYWHWRFNFYSIRAPPRSR